MKRILLAVLPFALVGITACTLYFDDGSSKHGGPGSGSGFPDAGYWPTVDAGSPWDPDAAVWYPDGGPDPIDGGSYDPDGGGPCCGIPPDAPATGSGSGGCGSGSAAP